jgi:hypothetical protein
MQVLLLQKYVKYEKAKTYQHPTYSQAPNNILSCLNICYQITMDNVYPSTSLTSLHRWQHSAILYH